MKPDLILENIKKVVEKENPPVVSLIAMQSKDHYKVLISTLLSSRTKDDVTLKASLRLFEKAPDLDKLSSLEESEISRLIYPVAFYNIKASNLKKIAKILVKKYNSRVPDSIEGLLSLPGVGRKTANLVLSEGFGKPVICVDTHVHRISNRLGIVNTKEPFDTEIQLMNFFPQELWCFINRYFVAFGQSMCKPVSPLCSKCPLRNFCPKKGVKRHR